MARLEDEAAQNTSALGPLIGLTREDIFGAVAVLLRETASDPARLMRHGQEMGGEMVKIMTGQSRKADAAQRMQSIKDKFSAYESKSEHSPIQLTANGTHRIHHVLQFTFRVGNTDFLDVRHALHGVGETRAFAFRKIQTQTHCIRHGQNIGKQNGSIQRVTL